MLYFENAPLDFLVTSVIDLRKSGWCHVTSVLLALFQYWLNNLDFEMKFNEENRIAIGKTSNSKVFMQMSLPWPIRMSHMRKL